jgi:excinuclease ABC subunit C
LTGVRVPRIMTAMEGFDQQFAKNFDYRSLPDSPGVYLMKDASGHILYVGKAKGLRARVGSYFRAGADLSPKTRAMLRQQASLDVLLTATEKEALLLEASLIKKHRPRYNIVLRDDKQYVLFKLDKTSRYPRLFLTRKVVRDGSLYHGPFTSARSAREAMKAILAAFPLRRCKDAVFRNRTRPCLYHSMKLCPAPCVGLVSQEEYAALVRQVEFFFAGRSRELTAALGKDMRCAAEALEFEKAAALRDRLEAVRKTFEEQAAVLPRESDIDVVGLAETGRGLALGLLFVRQGRLLGKTSFFWPGLALGDGDEGAESVAGFLAQYYGPGRFIPERILTPVDINDYASPGASSTDEEDSAVLAGPLIGPLIEVLGERRGGPVRIVRPRGKVEKRLMVLAETNARRDADPGPEGEASARLASTLGLVRPLVWVESVDVAHTGGKQTRAGMVVFEHGKPVKERNRLYDLDSVGITGGDDQAALAAWTARRMASGPPWPDLLVIDGGRGQLEAVNRTWSEAGVVPCALVALAKARTDKGRTDRRAGVLEEQVYIPGRKNSLRLKPASPEMLFLQRVRDAAHRFVIGGHRRARTRTGLAGELEALPGVGPATAKLLWAHFASLEAMAQAGVEELGALPGVGERRAMALHEALGKLRENGGAFLTPKNKGR